MGDALRQRRHRAHRRGDHALCLPRSCPDAPDSPQPTTQRDVSTQREQPRPPVVRAPRAVEVLERGPRAARLWESLQGKGLDEARLALAEEACRLVDLLDHLDALIAGRRRWVTTDEGGARVAVVVDGLLAERRQTAMALKGLVAEVAKGLPKAAAPEKKAGGVLDGLADELAARRRQGAAG